MYTRRTFKDLDFAFIDHPVTHDVSVLSGVDAIKQSIRDLIYTQHYEKPFHPEVGCYTTGLLFENIMPSTQIMIKKSVESVITNFEPRVNLLNVIVDVDPDNNGYNLRIEFAVKNQPDPVVFDMFLERLR
jgi:phage baseplate assembly protein W